MATTQVERQNGAPPRFSERVESQHQRIDADQWENIYVVGDVHGCRDEFEALLDRLDVTGDDLVVFVGDLVRKGPDTQGVLDLVRGRPNLLSVRGTTRPSSCAARPASTSRAGTPTSSGRFR